MNPDERPSFEKLKLYFEELLRRMPSTNNANQTPGVANDGIDNEGFEPNISVNEEG